MEENLILTTSTYLYWLLVTSSRRKHADLTSPSPMPTPITAPHYTLKRLKLVLDIDNKDGARKPEKGREGHHSWKQMVMGQDVVSGKEVGGAWS